MFIFLCPGRRPGSSAHGVPVGLLRLLPAQKNSFITLLVLRYIVCVFGQKKSCFGHVGGRLDPFFPLFPKKGFPSSSSLIALASSFFVGSRPSFLHSRTASQALACMPELETRTAWVVFWLVFWGLFCVCLGCSTHCSLKKGLHVRGGFRLFSLPVSLLPQAVFFSLGRECFWHLAVFWWTKCCTMIN